MKLKGQNLYHIVGIMSGTSLDGLDIALCTFLDNQAVWHYEVLKAYTIPYDPDWRQQLLQAMHADDKDLRDIDLRYGQLIGRQVNEFITGSGILPELIASHGHTVHHKPEQGITFQVGSGREIANVTGINTVADFRKTDVALGGQGAPLVPVGDELLFGEYDYCLNLGGICNISYKDKGIRLAYDIAPCNMILNYLSQKHGKEMDKDGHWGRMGTINHKLLDSLNALPYYSGTGPRSLGREWFEAVFMPLINQSTLPANDLFRTIYEHISMQIAGSLGNNQEDKVLVTGGGTYNKFLMELLQSHTPCKLVIPDPVLIEFKEAVVFAFLGLLRYLGRINCYASVTGAREDSSCGTLYVSLQR
jgi:anhydro-N-acetylmuramic acid kinase